MSMTENEFRQELSDLPVRQMLIIDNMSIIRLEDDFYSVTYRTGFNVLYFRGDSTEVIEYYMEVFG